MENTLSENLTFLKSKKASYEEVTACLFSYNYKDFNTLFNVDLINIPNQTYQRLPVFNNENCVAILMLWGVENQTAIHDHGNYNGKIKVLKGNLTEVYYTEKRSFIELQGERIATEGAIFDEELGGIHSIINNDPTFSVSLHIYHTPQLNLNGVRIFDTENKKWAILTDKAPSCSWNLPHEAFEKIYQL